MLDKFAHIGYNYKWECMLTFMVSFSCNVYYSKGVGRMKLSINLPEKLVDRIDDYANKHCLSRSAAISFAVADFLDGRQMLEKLPDFLEKMQVMSDMFDDMGIEEMKKAVNDE